MNAAIPPGFFKTAAFLAADMIDARNEKNRSMKMTPLIIFLFGGVSMTDSGTGLISGTMAWTSLFAPMAEMLTPTLKKVFPSKGSAVPLFADVLADDELKDKTMFVFFKT